MISVFKNFIFLIAFSTWLFSCHSAKQEEKKTPPNVLVLIADDWSYPHAGVYEEGPIETKTFDWIANEGVLFSNAFCIAPSCTASRASLLTGMYPHQLEEGVNLWSTLNMTFPTYTNILADHGYRVGHERKGWGPGNFEAGGYSHNPAGEKYNSFESFYDSLKEGQPFCFWFGSQDPHRPYDEGSGLAAGLDPDKVKVPGYLPDVPEVRSDLLDYFLEVKRFDDECGKIIHFLDSVGQLDNTVVIVTSDNGMPFPRAKAGIYDGGSRIPMAIYWKGFEQYKGKRVEDFVSLMDIAPTILSATLDTTVSTMAGKNLLTYMNDTKTSRKVFLERERHAYVRKDNLSFPMRAVRTRNFLYIKNLKPNRWPAGDPEAVYAVGEYGDVDSSPTKFFLMDHLNTSTLNREGNIDRIPIEYLAGLAFNKRPSEELYDLSVDPFQLKNVAQDEEYTDSLSVLRNQLKQWQIATYDPRLTEKGEEIDTYQYYGNKFLEKRDKK